MRKSYQTFFFIAIIILKSASAIAQSDSTPVSGNTDLTHIIDTKNPKQYIISEIDVSGAKSYDKNLIISISGLAVGDKLQIPGTDAINKAIIKLWKQNIISDVKIYFTKLEGNNLTIQIDITERPRLADFNFIGVKKGDADDLKNKINLVKNHVVTENMKQNAVIVIRKFYTDKGYRNVNVLISKEDTVPNLVNAEILTFTVDKGNKVRVNSVNFSSNNNIQSSTLKKQMKDTKEMSRLTLYPPKVNNPFGDTSTALTLKQYLDEMGFLTISQTKEFLDPYFRFKLFSSSKFDAEKYNSDRDKVLDYYNSQGYRDAIIADTASSINDKGNIDLFIKMNEGKQYYFGNITWTGNTKYTDSLLGLILGIKKGDIYNAELLNERLGKELSPGGGDISSLYMDDGYLFFHLDPIETAVYGDTIDFEVRMQEGPQATIGKVDITGNEKTKDYVVRRELRTIPGEKFSRSDLIRTQRELSQLGFFNPEKIEPNVVPNADNGTVDITWKVAEKSNDQLELSAGWGGGIGLTGTLGVTFNNFSLKNFFDKKTWDPLPSGDGQKLSARIQSNGSAYRSYNFSFTEPWLGGKRHNPFTVSVYNTKYSNSVNPLGGICTACADTSYIRILGASVSLGKQLKWPDDYFSLVYSLNYQNYYLKNYPNIFKGLSNGTSSNISFKVTLSRSSAGPNPMFPTSGSNFFLSSQFTLPYSLLGVTNPVTNPYQLVEFHKWRFDGDYYIPLGIGRGENKDQQLVLRFAAKYGYIGRYNKNLQVSPFERFQVGDAGLSNSFALLGYDIISQRGYPVYSSSDPKVNPDNVTPTEFFTIFNKYTMELRYPFSTSQSATIYGLGFFEAANGWYDFNSYNPFQLRRSVGVGMRFFLPMFGLLGFDYGIGLDRIVPGQPLSTAAKFTFMLGQEPE
jgi:outer membrane protein insertion porin family